MILNQIFIREATREDIPLVAKSVMAAAHMNDFPAVSAYDEEFCAICARTDTLYSFKNSRIITIGGTPVGCMISYPGEIYKDAREVTFKMFSDVPENVLEGTGIEAFPGEWYLDSLAVLPAYRNYGLGTKLLEDAIHTGRSKGFTKFSLIVEKASTELIDYYSSFGFVPAEDITFFGDPYMRMVKESI